MSATTEKSTPTKKTAAKAQPPVEEITEAEPSAVEEVEDDGGRDEVERLDPSDGRVVLEDGTVVAVTPLRFRQFLRLTKILTRGATGAMDSLQLNANQDQGAFVQQLLVLVMLAIPEAEDETVAFIQSMCVLDDSDTSGKSDLELYSYLNNPELDEIVSILEVIVYTEGRDIQALGKRLAAMMNRFQGLPTSKK